MDAATLVGLVLLTQPVVRARRVLLYLATVSGSYLALGIALLAGATWLVDVGGGALTSSPAYVVQAVLGAGLIALSFRYDARPTARRRAARGGAPTRTERWWRSAAGAVLAGYVAVMLAPATALLLVRLAAGERLAAPLTRARQWLAARTAGALGTVIGLAGLLLLVDAVRVLGGRGLLWW